MTLHLGFTGTRHGMSPAQHARMLLELDRLIDLDEMTNAHHGCCVGADAQFHAAVRDIPCVCVVGHPGPDWPDGDLCDRSLQFDALIRPRPHMQRNREIVADSKVMLAAPFEDEPQMRGGTWKTIGMARRALERGDLRELVVIGRTGFLLDHTKWKRGAP